MIASSKISFGLRERDIRTVHNILSRYPSVLKVVIFGSSAKGTVKTGSDIDLAIMNDGVEERDVRAIVSELEESNLPYFVHVVNYPLLQHGELREHIDRAGVVFYDRSALIHSESN